MDDCGCQGRTDTASQRRVLGVALALNAAMFGVGLVAGLVGQSTSLIADSLDMLADAAAYAIALSAFRRGDLFKAGAARLSGTVLMVLGVSVLADAARRGVMGSAPESAVMIGVASVSLLVNATVLYLLGRFRDREVHVQATWIFTRVDVIANLAVIASGLAIMFTGWRFIDLIVGCGIGLYVIKEAMEILGEARQARDRALAKP